MTTESNIKNKVVVRVVFDLVCPWCLIGKRQFGQALATLTAEQRARVVVQYVPFFLNPDTAQEGEAFRPFLVQKFGSEQAVDTMFQCLNDVAAPLGFQFNFAAIATRANTLLGHTAVQSMQLAEGDASPLVEKLFQAYFINGLSLSEPAVIDEYMADFGLTDGEWRVPTVQQEVFTLAESYRQAGVNSVPTHIFANNHAYAGAIGAEQIAEELRQSLAPG